MKRKRCSITYRNRALINCPAPLYLCRCEDMFVSGTGPLRTTHAVPHRHPAVFRLYGQAVGLRFGHRQRAVLLCGHRRTQCNGGSVLLHASPESDADRRWKWHYGPTAGFFPQSSTPGCSPSAERPAHRFLESHRSLDCCLRSTVRRSLSLIRSIRSYISP